MRKTKFVDSELTIAVDSWALYYRLWVRVLFLCMAWSLPISVIRLSALFFPPGNHKFENLFLLSFSIFHSFIN